MLVIGKGNVVSRYREQIRKKCGKIGTQDNFERVQRELELP